ncbi:hypothetical protein KN246_15850 [Mycobacterium intracellulare]|uniref:hypothetical protein n=1 Tax=Mycobacterium intracellulare TaxID=1767 RepID=UPI001E474D84|nr:hypothetical protein [Mycobacterium intracellulare]UGT94863.1 hypothetical protein LTQ55_13770 [Mycobacterium intracellulare]UQB95739.1 hypothetical protein KN246_15850 [Mycobacterium intracellulare]
MGSLTCENAEDHWLDGTAEVVSEFGGGITVSCPHCGGRHQHPASFKGSKQVLAGCHTGHGRCRTYSVPGEPPRRRPRWMA